MLEQPLGLGDAHPDTPVGGRIADGGRVGRPMDANAAGREPHPARSERVSRPRRDRACPGRPRRVGRIPPRISLLDGDVVRTNLSRELGFSREDRNTNVRRIGFVASEIVRHGGVAVCAAVSPYRDTRDEIRNMVGPECFFEVFVDTPLETCERRDPKGLYAKARRGEIRGFTGIDDPYEPPLSAEITLGTLVHSAEENARLILDHMVQRGLVREA